MDDIYTPVPIGSGHTLSYQEIKDKGLLRAVIKDVNGAIIARGCVVPRNKAAVSKMNVLGSTEWLAVIHPAPERNIVGDEPLVDEDDDELDFEDEE